LNDRASKIVLTSRVKKVCTSMEGDEITRVEPLSVEEGWQLYCCRAFPNGSFRAEIGNSASKIERECKGLALTINAVTALVRNYTYQDEWEHALHQTHNIDDMVYGLHDEIEEQLLQSLKWSCNGLQDYLKTCLVYFASFPANRVIHCEKIINIWIAEGMVMYILHIFLS